jgi:hypothetical protein
MWHDQPKYRTVVKFWQVRHRVAAELKLPIYAFSAGGWKKRVREIVNREVVCSPD